MRRLGKDSLSTGGCTVCVRAKAPSESPPRSNPVVCHQPTHTLLHAAATMVYKHATALGATCLMRVPSYGTDDEGGMGIRIILSVPLHLIPTPGLFHVAGWRPPMEQMMREDWEEVSPSACLCAKSDTSSFPCCRVQISGTAPTTL